MKKTQIDLDKMITEILQEEIEIKSKQIVEKVETGEWMEIDMEEELHGNQKKLDKNHNGKIDAEDFKLLRKKKETKEDDFDSLVDSDVDIEMDRDSLEQGMYENDETSEEAETDEGNAFTGALAKAKEEGDDTFEVDGEKFHVKEGKGKGKAAVKETIQLTESELIDMIERIVLEKKEEKKVADKAEKQSITKKSPEGLKKTEKALNASKKENEDYAKQVVKKMKDYVKAGSKGEFTESPDSFPQNNYQLGGMKEKTKKYHPSQAVDEYIEYFSYPGQTNLVFDEIKPNDEKIEKHLKGHSTMGNAEVDSDGKALGNVVPSKVGEKFYKNYKDNVYGNEQMKASYKRYPMPVEQEGEEKTSGSLADMKKTSKGTNVLNKLSESKESEKVTSEMDKMKKLMSYSKKTQ